MNILLDCYGGDNSPLAQIEGAVNAVKKNSGLNISLVGKTAEIKQTLEKFPEYKNAFEIIDASEVVSCNDKPTTALKDKPNSSMAIAFDKLKEENYSALITSGSTGAALVGGVTKIGRIKGISRPALAPLLPTENGKNVMLLDCGANVDCKAKNLQHFAIMAAVYFKEVLAIKNPRVALLSNGTEDEKGSLLTKEAFSLIKELDGIDFLGNMEARDILSGKYDIVVTDGFNGNIALKSMEGAMVVFMRAFKRKVLSSFKAKIGALFLKKEVKALKKELDYNEKGGAVFLGLKKPLIKAHGAATAIAIENTLLQTYMIAEKNIVEKIANCVENLEEN